MDLLSVVQAEEHAEELVKKAEEEREVAIAKAREESVYKLENLKTPTPKKITLTKKRPNLKKWTDAARKNKRAAIKRILEELYAAA